MTLKERRAKQREFVGKWVPKADKRWIRMMERHRRRKAQKEANARKTTDR